MSSKITARSFKVGHVYLMRHKKQKPVIVIDCYTEYDGDVLLTTLRKHAKWYTLANITELIDKTEQFEEIAKELQ